MDNRILVERIMRNLSFEVEPILDSKTVQNSSTSSKIDPMNVRVKVRKKEMNELHSRGFISNNQSKPDKLFQNIRLVSSQETIMSFDMLMEAEDKNMSRKPGKHIFDRLKPGICLGATTDEDDQPYMPNPTLNMNPVSKSNGKLRQLSLTKNTHKTRERTERTFLGKKCKPGGCLDPPFTEDTYTYMPSIKDTQEQAQSNNDKGKLEQKASAEKSNVKNIEKINKKSKDPSIYIDADDDKVEESDSVSITYKEDSTKNSIIKYPPDDKNKEIKSKEGSENKSRRPNDESVEMFFPPPKGTKRISSDNVKRDSTRRQSNNPKPIKNKHIDDNLHIPLSPELQEQFSSSKIINDNIPETVIKHKGEISTEPSSEQTNDKQKDSIQADKDFIANYVDKLDSPTPSGRYVPTPVLVSISCTSISQVKISELKINGDIISTASVKNKQQIEPISSSEHNKGMQNEMAVIKTLIVEELIIDNNSSADITSNFKTCSPGLPISDTEFDFNDGNILGPILTVAEMINQASQKNKINDSQKSITNYQNPQETSTMHVITDQTEKSNEIVSIANNEVDKLINNKLSPAQNLSQELGEHENVMQNPDGEKSLMEMPEVHNISHIHSSEKNSNEISNIADKTDEVQTTLEGPDDPQSPKTFIKSTEDIHHSDGEKNLMEKPEVHNMSHTYSLEINSNEKPNLVENSDKVQNILEANEMNYNNYDPQNPKTSIKSIDVTDPVTKVIQNPDGENNLLENPELYNIKHTYSLELNSNERPSQVENSDDVKDTLKIADELKNKNHNLQSPQSPIQSIVVTDHVIDVMQNLDGENNLMEKPEVHNMAHIYSLEINSIEISNLVENSDKVQNILEGPDEINYNNYDPQNPKTSIKSIDSTDHVLKVMQNLDGENNLMEKPELNNIKHTYSIELNSNEITNLVVNSEEVQNTFKTSDEFKYQNHDLQSPKTLIQSSVVTDHIINGMQNTDTYTEKYLINKPELYNATHTHSLELNSNEIRNRVENSEEVQNKLEEPDEINYKDHDQQSPNISIKSIVVTDHVFNVMQNPDGENNLMDMTNTHSLELNSNEKPNLVENSEELQNTLEEIGEINYKDHDRQSPKISMNSILVIDHAINNLVNTCDDVHNDITDRKSKNNSSNSNKDSKIPQIPVHFSDDITEQQIKINDQQQNQLKRDQGMNVEQTENQNKSYKGSLPHKTSKNSEEVSKNIASIEHAMSPENDKDVELETTFPSKIERRIEDALALPNDILKYDISTVSVNLIFHSYMNSDNEWILKTFSNENEVSRCPKDNITVINSCIKISSKQTYPKFIIPINSIYDMTIKINKTKHQTDTISETLQKKALSNYCPSANKIETHRSAERKLLDRSVMNDTLLYDTLNDIYEQELIPLQKMIKTLRAEIDALAKQRTILKKNVLCLKKCPRLTQ